MSVTEFATGSDNLILGSPGPCFVCGKITPWIEINFEGHLCSSRCSERVDEELLRDGNAGPCAAGLDMTCEFCEDHCEDYIGPDFKM